MENTTLPPPLQVTYPNSSVTAVLDSKYYYRERLHILSIVMYSLIFVLGVTGNGLVIFITGFQMKKTVNTIWFLNLAIADFTYAFFLPLSITSALKSEWPFGEAMCKVQITLLYINLYASVYLLTVISIDRCVSVWCPVWAQNHRTSCLASFVVLGVWILALVLSSPFIYSKHIVRNGTCNIIFSEDKEKARITRRDVNISILIFAFVIPFTVIIVCYGAIVLRLRRDRLAPSSKPFKVIAAAIVAFFVCWFPFHILSLLQTRGHDDPTFNIAFSLACILASMNSCLNPILYVFMVHDFRESLKRSFLSVFEKAFAEEVSQSTRQTKTQSSIELDSQLV